MNQLAVEAIPTRIFNLGEPLAAFVIKALQNRNDLEGKVLAITSKIVSLSEGRVVSRSVLDKAELVRNEADIFLGEMGYGCFLTIKHGLLIPSAGIDESNSQTDGYILYPKDPFASARQLYTDITTELKLQRFGILLTDSHTTPLRVGVTGISLAHFGFRGVRNFVGESDLFGRKLKMTRINVADALAASAVLCMGESNESCPLALVSGNIEFVENHSDAETECRINPQEDLYSPFYRTR